MPRMHVAAAERLSGNLEPWEARARVEYLKTRRTKWRRNWDLAYQYISESEAVATLETVEEAFRKVHAGTMRVGEESRRCQR